ncbi:hypothetical protein [Rahnella sp. R3(2024)]|uniref:hypothetical protein n=1 Tax=Rahnella sp. R3(2024) TaxID=3163550 RepID=UPI0036EE02EB
MIEDLASSLRIITPIVTIFIREVTGDDRLFQPPATGIFSLISQVVFIHQMPDNDGKIIIFTIRSARRWQVSNSRWQPWRRSLRCVLSSENPVCMIVVKKRAVQEESRERNKKPPVQAGDF